MVIEKMNRKPLPLLFLSDPPKVTAPATVEALSGSRVELLCTVLVPYATSFIPFEVLNAS